MAYEKHTWACGETITEAKLNNIEDGIEEALECCEGGGDSGFSCTETRTFLLEESITTEMPSGATEADAQLSSTVTGDKIFVTLDGAEYVANNRGAEDLPEYGAPYNGGAFDWSEYPFAIMRGNYFITPSAGTYSVKIEALTESVSYTDCFYKAVKKVVEEMNTVWIDATGDFQPCGAVGCQGEPRLQISRSAAEAYASAGKIIKVHDKITGDGICSGPPLLEGKTAIYDATTNSINIVQGGYSPTWSYISEDDNYGCAISCPY